MSPGRRGPTTTLIASCLLKTSAPTAPRPGGASSYCWPSWWSQYPVSWPFRRRLPRSPAARARHRSPPTNCSTGRPPPLPSRPRPYPTRCRDRDRSRPSRLTPRRCGAWSPPWSSSPSACSCSRCFTCAGPGPNRRTPVGARHLPRLPYQGAVPRISPARRARGTRPYDLRTPGWRQPARPGRAAWPRPGRPGLPRPAVTRTGCGPWRRTGGAARGHLRVTTPVVRWFDGRHRPYAAPALLPDLGAAPADRVPIRLWPDAVTRHQPRRQ